jgi:ribonuclease P protein component
LCPAHEIIYQIMAKQFTLAASERLKSRKAIEQLFREGKAFTLLPFRVYYQPGNAPGSSLQFGAGVSTKNFKRAVDRNRVKRVMREAWRLQKTVLQDQLKEQNGKLDVFMIYTGRVLPEYKEVHEKTSRVISKLCHLVTTNK